MSTNEEYKKWCQTTIAEMRKMALQWDDLSHVYSLDESARTAYKDASMTLENYVERVRWIVRNKQP